MNLFQFCNFSAFKGWVIQPDCADCWDFGYLGVGTEDVCKTLADRWGLNWKGSVGTNSSLPKGCIWKGYNDTYFNEAKEGMKQKGINCICYDPDIF